MQRHLLGFSHLTNFVRWIKKNFRTVKLWQNKFPSSTVWSLAFSVSDSSFTNFQDNTFINHIFDKEIQKKFFFSHKPSVLTQFRSFSFSVSKPSRAQTVFWTINRPMLFRHYYFDTNCHFLYQRNFGYRLFRKAFFGRWHELLATFWVNDLLATLFGQWPF